MLQVEMLMNRFFNSLNVKMFKYGGYKNVKYVVKHISYAVR